MLDLLGVSRQLRTGRHAGSGIAPSRSTNDLASAAAAAAAADAASVAASTGRPTSRERRLERRLLQGEGGAQQQQLQLRYPRRNLRVEALQQQQQQQQQQRQQQQPPPAALGELLEIRTTQSLILQRREPSSLLQNRPVGQGCPMPPSRQSSFGSALSEAGAVDALQQPQLESTSSFCSVGSAFSRRLNTPSSQSGFYGNGSNRRSGLPGSGSDSNRAPAPEKYRFSDPSVGAANHFSQRLSEMTSLVAETVRFERGRTGKAKRK